MQKATPTALTSDPDPMATPLIVIMEDSERVSGLAIELEREGVQMASLEGSLTRKR